MWQLFPVPRPGRLHEVAFPAKLIRRRAAGDSGRDRLNHALLLAAALVVNSLLYAVPPAATYASRYLSLSPIHGSFVPSVFTNAAAIEVVVRYASTLVFVTLTTFAGFYVGLWLVRAPRAPLQTVEAAVASSSLYLGASFALLQHLLSLPNGRRFVTTVSAWIVHTPLDIAAQLLNISQERLLIPQVPPIRVFPVGIVTAEPKRPVSAVLAQLTGYETVVLGLLAVTVCLYAYSFYCTARIHARTRRTTGVVVVGTTLLGPYVAIGTYLLTPTALRPAVFGVVLAVTLMFLWTLLTRGE